VVRRIEDLAALFPKEIRNTSGINESDSMGVFIDQHGIFLRPYQSNVSKKEPTHSELNYLNKL
jgi:bifunctional DNA-binding transcriptional regulator/antitoxin component of YhaV-PrlF toxin-antitoxin module